MEPEKSLSSDGTGAETASQALGKLSRHWDAAVIGAGPAGAVSALLLARQGKKVLLIDKAAFPRNKVCGACLSEKTIRLLGSAGLGDLPTSLQASKISALELSTAAGTIKIDLPLALALSRAALDSAIVERAREEGAVFIPSTAASVGPCQEGRRVITLRDTSQGQSQSRSENCAVQAKAGAVTVYAGCVLVADGINGRALADLPGAEKNIFAPVVARASRIGAGVIVAGSPELDNHYPSGSIFMAVHRGGYVGLVRLEDGRLDLAAALEPLLTRQAGSPRAAAKHILGQVGLPYLPCFDQGHWLGTAPLTRHRQALAAERLFIIGDAACYSEPFTGEGIAWATGSALLVVPLAASAIENWNDSLIADWHSQHKKMIGKKQAVSRRLGALLRNDQFSRLAIAGVLKHLPGLAKPIVDRVCR